MAAQHSPTLRSLYRRLLRELPSKSTQNETILSHPSPVQQHIRSSFSTPSSTNSETAILPKIQEAEQFVQYVKAQRMYATLIERYNPGMTMDEETRVRLTARKVGMDLPIEFQQGKN